MLNRPQEYEKMAEVERNLWWYLSLHELVADSIRCEIPVPDTSRILDAGCGTGGLMLFLQERGYRHVQGFDLSEHAVVACRAKGLLVEKDSLVNIAHRYGDQLVDVIVSNDTLCYLEEEQQKTFVAGCYAVLKPGGVLIMNLPALTAFRGIHDISVGICQRFTRTSVRGLFRDSGFTFIRETYWPFLASPPIYVARLWQRLQMRMRSDFEVRSDVSLPPLVVNGLLYRLTRCENRWLRRKPWGSSLFVVARRSAVVSQQQTVNRLPVQGYGRKQGKDQP